MSRRNLAAEAAFIAAGSLLTGKADAQRAASPPQKIEMSAKKETALDPKIKEILTELEEEKKNLAGNSRAASSLEQNAYLDIIQVIISKLDKFLLLDRPRLTAEEENALRAEAKKMGLTNELIRKCLDFIGKEGAHRFAIPRERALLRIDRALAPSFRDIKGPPKIFP